MYVKKNFIRILLSVTFLGMLVSCTKSGQTNTGTGTVQPRNVLEIKPVTVTIHEEYPATLKGQQVIEIRPKIDGYIEEICVAEGASVKKGQLLFRLNNPQYQENLKTAEASIKSAEAEVYSARMNVEKVKPLVEKDIVSKYELESAQYALQAKEAALAQAKASLGVAQTNLAYTQVCSPLDGVIGNIPYKTGALVSSSSASALTVLSDIRKIYAYFSINEKQLLDLSRGYSGDAFHTKIDSMPGVLLVLSDGSSYPETGKLELASALINTETGTASLKALFPNPYEVLRSGASAKVKIPQTIGQAFLVPQSATYEVLDKHFVYVVGKNNKVFSVAIKTTPTDDGQFYIVTSGLKPGDRIVLEGLTSLKDSTLINPVIKTDAHI